MDTDDKETQIRADIPLPYGITPYAGKTEGDWGDTTEYGINLNKTGELGNWDYNLTGNIDQDKDYRLQADIGRSLGVFKEKIIRQRRNRKSL